MMLYRVLTAFIENDGTLKVGKRKQLYQTRQQLNIGGLYFLRPGRLYKVVEQISTGRDEDA